MSTQLMDAELAESIGTAARNGRIALTLTQEDCAEFIAISAEFYARIERGNALPSVPTLARISEVLGVRVDMLIGRIEPESNVVVAGPPTRGSPLTPMAPRVPQGLSRQSESPELREIAERLRTATPGILRLIGLFITEVMQQHKHSHRSKVQTTSEVRTTKSDEQKIISSSKSDELMTSIGVGMHRARAHLGLTQTQVAVRIGLTSQYYGRIERGEALPSVRALKRISDQLDVSADGLLGIEKKAFEYHFQTPTLVLDPLPVRRLLRRLRHAPSATLRMVLRLLREFGHRAAG